MADEQETQQNIEPPQPPKIKPEFKLYPYQYIAIPLLLLIPILALFSVFGDHVVEADATNGDLQMRIEYPVRTHYRLHHEMIVEVTNTSDQMLPSLTVQFETSLMRAFIDIVFTQEPNRVTDEAYEVAFENVAPGETRRVSADVRAERYWSHNGSISATAQGVEPVSIPLSVFIFP